MARTDLPAPTLLLQEIQSLTSSMRRNQRWASTSSSSFASSAAPLPPSLAAKAGSRGMNRGKRVREVEEGDLMEGFVELKRSLSGVKDITTLAPSNILSPFLALVRSPLTSGPITSLALSALHSITLSILPLYFTPSSSLPALSTPLQIALAHLTATLSICRFPSSSPQQDELVLLRLLRLIETLTVPMPAPTSSSSAAYWCLMDHMGDESVCELLEVGLGMLARARLTEGLRNSAGVCVQSIVRAVFRRLGQMKQGDVEKIMEVQKQLEEREKAKAKRSIEQTRGDDNEAKPSADADGIDKSKEGELAIHVASGETGVQAEPQPRVSSDDTDDSPEDATPIFTPYGLPTVLELLRVLIALLNPSDQAHTDSMRLSALAILNTALEVGGASLGEWPELKEGVRDEGCRYLFQLTRSDSPALLASSLRTTSTLFSTLLPHLKPQLELFLSYLIDRLTPQHPAPSLPIHNFNPAQPNSRPGTPGFASQHRIDTPLAADGEKDPVAALGNETPQASTPRALSLLPPVPVETKELMLDTLVQLATEGGRSAGGFMVNCWVNYDCDVDSEDIFERLVAFLTRGVYPAGPAKADGSTSFEGLENVQLICLEILLDFVGSMSERSEQGDEPWAESFPTSEELSGHKSTKSLYLTGAAMFNAKPKNGVAFLEKHGIITPDAPAGEDDTDAKRRTRGIAKFLKGSAASGSGRLDKKELGEYISRPDQVELLKAFIGSFDFSGKSIADAMRELLETFRLPGEAQPIARITETFAEHFFSFSPPEIASQDAVYVLAYSVIMLNTDLHNPQNRKRMTIEDYSKNLRGVNDGKDFNPQYLANIHESIKKSEIILPEEHAGQHGFDYAWKSLMQRSRTSGPMVICNTSLFDSAMFRLTWRSVISAIAYAFTLSAGDDFVIQKAITGFRQCAYLASQFDVPEVFDTIVQSLAGATGLLEDGSDTSGFPTIEKDGQKLVVSPLSIRFGQSYRSQLATVVLFTITNGNAGAVRAGWTSIFEMFTTLFAHSLLPPPMLVMEDFLAGVTTIPMKVAQPAVAAPARAEGGLLSTLSSYLLSPYGGSSDALASGVNDVGEEDLERTLVAVDCLGSCKLEELYGEILNLELDALLPALRAIRHLAEQRTTARLAARTEVRSETGSPILAPREGQLRYDPACVFLLEMMVSIGCRGKKHIAETWPILFEYLEQVLGSAQSYSVLFIERAVVGLLRLCLIVSESPDLRDQLYLALDVLRSLPSTVLNAVSEQLMAGVAKILDQQSGPEGVEVVRSQTEWGLIIALFRATVAHPEAGKTTLEIVQKMARGPAAAGEPGRPKGLQVSRDNYEGVVALLDEFATAAGAAAAGRGRDRRASATLGPTVERGLTALDSLYELRNVIPTLLASTDLDPQAGWNTFWLPPLLVISKQCVNTHREIRQRAIIHLQRLLLSPQLLDDTSAPASSTSPTKAKPAAASSQLPSILPIVFDRVLFPVLEELLKPQVYERDPGGFGETRLRAATLLCKVFLQYVVRLVDPNAPSAAEAQTNGAQGTKSQVEGVFVKVLEKLERFMRGEREMLNEAGESLKNVVLVMHSSGLLMPPSMDAINGGPDTRSNEQKELWERSVGGIERVLPGFVREAMPPAPSAPVAAPPVVESAGTTGTSGAEVAKAEGGKLEEGAPAPAA